MTQKKKLKFKSEADYIAYCNRERIRVRLNQRRRYEFFKPVGICHRCDTGLCEINPKTKKPFWACRDCRIKHESAARRRYAARARICGNNGEVEKTSQG